MRSRELTKWAAALATATILATAAPAVVRADEWHGWHGDIHHFTEHDWARWRGGGWRHVWHDGRLGWWWVVGGAYWYPYAAPIYPYPDPFVPPAVVINQGPPGVPMVPGAPPGPPAAPAPQGPPPAQFWYYCDSPQGYYPYVTSCPSQWRQVPVAPAGGPPPR